MTCTLYPYLASHPFSLPPSLAPSFRLWDVETGQELLLQDGHYKETHAIAFQVGREGGRERGGDGGRGGYLVDCPRSWRLVFVFPACVQTDLRPSSFSSDYSFSFSFIHSSLPPSLPPFFPRDTGRRRLGRDG
jgi:hypothetical protein